MGTRKKQSEFLGPAAFVQLTMPFWEAVLETDTPDVVFQPVKAMALGQIQAAALFNRRCLACLELSQKLAACRSPEDFLQVQQTFLQDAMRDYSDTVQAMTGAFDNVIADPAADVTQSKAKHDYLPLPNSEPEGDELREDGGDHNQQTSSKPEQTVRQLNGAQGRVRP